MGLFDPNFWKAKEPSKDSKLMHTLFDGFFTFLFKPNETTSGKGTHIKGAMDLKRLMVHVVIALQLCYIVGAYNIGYQHFLALGVHTGILEAFHLKMAMGLLQILPIFIVTHVVGLGVEFYFAAKKGHPIEEGFLVSGALIPLIMPPDIPLWMLSLAVIFAVVLGKEAFGGTGMNILNVALLARVFIFFAYPTEISGDMPWIAGLTDAQTASEYPFYYTMLNPLFGAMGLSQFESGLPVISNFSGATPMADAYLYGWEGVQERFSSFQMFMGGIPGSIGETCKPAVILGAGILLATGVASWRIMLSMTIGIALTGMLFNVWDATPFMSVPWHQHFVMGSALFAMVFMATDPVTASGTNTGKWIYGFLIGFFGLVIRVLNPAYPEGWMLAILLMNVFAPTIDYFVIDANIAKRMKRVKAK